MHPLLNIAINAARQASAIIVRYSDQLDRINITAKSAHDYSSEVDIKAEQAIIQTIHKAYPSHGIIAEETGNIDTSDECVWIIDPLDGTRNYLHGFPMYAVSIAVRIKNRLEHAVIYDPIRHECFTASRGSGARLNDHRLRVSKQTQLDGAMLGAGLPKNKAAATPEHLATVRNLFSQCTGIRRMGSAALDLAYVASGRLDACWAINLNLWDMAAGVLLVQEAGGLISDLNGRETHLSTGNIVAGTPKVFKALLGVFNS